MSDGCSGHLAYLNVYLAAEIKICVKFYERIRAKIILNEQLQEEVVTDFTYLDRYDSSKKLICGVFFLQ